MNVFYLCAGPIISHIFYVNDCLLIGQATLEDAITLTAIIDAYFYHSGQNVNYTKSHIPFGLATFFHVRSNILIIFDILDKTLPW